MNFAKFLRTPFLQNTFARLLLKWNKTKRLPLLIAFSSLSDISTTLKIGITITWSFTLSYVIAITHYDAGKRYHITMSHQSQYVIGLYRDVNPINADIATISGAHWKLMLIISLSAHFAFALTIFIIISTFRIILTFQKK